MASLRMECDGNRRTMSGIQLQRERRLCQGDSRLEPNREIYDVLFVGSARYTLPQ